MVSEIKLNVPNENIISLLEGYLKEAKEGKIQAIGIFGVKTKCTTFNVFDGHFHPVLLLGELRLLERDLIDICCDTRRKVDWDFTE